MYKKSKEKRPIKGDINLEISKDSSPFGPIHQNRLNTEIGKERKTPSPFVSPLFHFILSFHSISESRTNLPN